MAESDEEENEEEEDQKLPKCPGESECSLEETANGPAGEGSGTFNSPEHCCASLVVRNCTRTTPTTQMPEIHTVGNRIMWVY